MLSCWRRRNRERSHRRHPAERDRSHDAGSTAGNFISSFAGQWLGARNLGSHQIEASAFPAFNEPVRQAMEEELTLYFNEFLNGNLPFSQFSRRQSTS